MKTKQEALLQIESILEDIEVKFKKAQKIANQYSLIFEFGGGTYFGKGCPEIRDYVGYYRAEQLEESQEGYYWVPSDC